MQPLLVFVSDGREILALRGLLGGKLVLKFGGGEGTGRRGKWVGWKSYFPVYFCDSQSQ